MKRNRKWISLRKRLGANGPGLTVAVVAMLVALTGGAFAASGGLSSKQKKQVKAIAQTEAKKFAAAGPIGPQGPAGPAGAKGEKGDTGTIGKNGKSVTVTSIPTGEIECELRGGAAVEEEGSGSPIEVCAGKEGKEGSPWTAGGTLPVGSTETGSWSFTGTTANTNGIRVPLNFPIPLAAGLSATKVHWQEEANFADFDGAGPETIGCKNPKTGEPSPALPTAPSGNLCVYNPSSSNPLEHITFQGIFKPASPTSGGAGISGAILQFSAPTAEVVPTGTFAVTG